MAVAPPIQALVQQAGENFPVASVLLPKPARRAILHFYALARQADDIADSPTLSAQEKIAILSHVQLCIREGNVQAAPLWAQDYIADTVAGKSAPQHGVHLLQAFLQDARKNRYLSFHELRDYCRLSAEPVGRVVLESCGETGADVVAADALCAALQLMNHVQDVQQDYRQLNRIYLPKDWMQQEGVGEHHLDAAIASASVRRVLDRMLDECRKLLGEAAPLPGSIRSRRLRLELGLIYELALALVARLADHDPLRRRVGVARWQWPFYMLRSVRHL